MAPAACEVNCEHDFTGDPPAQSCLVVPVRCLYCCKWLYGIPTDLWVCSHCGGCCHKRCVPAPLRVETLRRQQPADARPAAIILRDRNGPCSDEVCPPEDGGADGSLIDCDVPIARFPGDLDAAPDIDFAFPEIRSRGLISTEPVPAVSMDRILSVFRDLANRDGKRGLSGVAWNLFDMFRLSQLHHRRYLRRLKEATVISDTTVVEQLNHAFRYARGAYGNGKLHHVVTGHGAGFDSAAYMDEALELLGWAGARGRGRGRMLQWDWLPQGASAHSPGYYVAADVEHRRAVVGIRGTQFTSDLYIDVNIEPAPFLGGFVHSGILEAAQHLWQEIRHCVLREFMPGRGGAYEGWPLVLSGHSLGGGVAACLSLLMEREGVADALNVKCFGFGVPPCFSEDLADRCQRRMVTVVNGKDVAPRAGLAEWDLLEKELRMPSGLWGAHHLTAAAAAALSVAALATPARGRVPRRHLSTRTIARTSAPDPKEGLPSGVQFSPPGAVYVLHASDSSDEERPLRQAAGTKADEVTLFRLPGRDLGGLCICRQMVAAHPWRSYWTSVTRLYDSWSVAARANRMAPGATPTRRGWGWVSAGGAVRCGQRPQKQHQQQHQDELRNAVASS
eukprot:TRINITY_DN1277_c2_g1_i1.p1 TRINITY_DN1277_c2_g1~~TRINITY_DN1277_c2_g1_i1.p1  ORF type:complete len:619 (+),score=128.31 TRINITY_DN1277_c2_g1_i1:45-1901(+)